MAGFRIDGHILNSKPVDPSTRTIKVIKVASYRRNILHTYVCMYMHFCVEFNRRN